MTPQGSGAPSPVRIFEAMNAYQRTGALLAGIQLGVFTLIADGAASAVEIAAGAGASERGVRILCDTLVIDGLLTKTENRYANTEDAAIFLSRHSPAYVGTAAEFLNEPAMVAAFIGSVTDAVRKGGTMMPGAGTVEPDHPVWVKFARGMAPMIMPAANAIAGIAGPGPLKVLDIAAGHGIFGISIAERNPQARITALDWAAVLEVVKENADKAGVGARVAMLQGSAFTVKFGTDYDLVLITNFLHHFDAETNTGFLRRVHAALKPGGRAITLEFVPDEDRVTPPGPARFAMTMLATTERGDAYTFSELEAMCRAAGFGWNEHVRLETGQSVIISTK